MTNSERMENEGQLPTSAQLSQPPSYLAAQATRHRHTRKQRRQCFVCRHHSDTDSESKRFMGPYLLQYDSRVYWINTCRCFDRQVHASCLDMILNKTKTTTTNETKETAEEVLECNRCHYKYRGGWRLWWVRVMACCVHLFSLCSVLGLVYGLSFLGRSLDQLGLGAEMGAKLDGDENWQDHEMQAISDWLNLVHFVTALAGEALLGLVYLVGVCLTIGSDRTLHMIHAIVYLDLKPLLRQPTSSPLTVMTSTTSSSSATTPSGSNTSPSTSSRSIIRSATDLYANVSCFQQSLLWLTLVFFGLILGTYFLFYSWVWACLFHLLCRRLLNVKSSNITPSIA